MFVGLVAAVITLSLIHPPPEIRANPGYLQLISIAPLEVWAVLWGFTGGLCLVQAFFRSDRVAFAVTTALMYSWGLIHFAGSLTGVNPRGWVSGAVWLGFGGWLTLISTWPEAAALPPEPHQEK
ncbi:hypothetical protein [Nonomuraea sp. LPB2021202275-12-8]|uniref:hypothetical protein n=1 Tax=Nonomuraea sp. LPB2021202275-12-8 TaxID=3120159 RepID=UPI00300D147C